MLEIKPQKKVTITGYRIDVDREMIDWLFASNALPNIKWTDVRYEPWDGPYYFTLSEDDLKQLYVILSKHNPELDNYRGQVVMDKIIWAIMEISNE